MRDLKEYIRSRYGQAAQQARRRTSGQGAPSSGCCGSGSDCCAEEKATVAGLGYTPDEIAQLPAGAVVASLGCGNPTALAELHPGEVVLDLGSGGGIDVLLSARRVGPTGKAYGLDMTDEMLALARENQRQAGVENAEFLKGEIEAIPLPDNSVDVIISNCVINLAADKDRVLREAFRVLKPGGRLAISDVIFVGDKSSVPAAIRNALEAWAGCVAGALEQQEYLAKLQAAGFAEPSVEPVQFYDAAATGEGCCGSDDGCCDGPAGALPPDLPVRLASGFIRARKPDR